MRYVIASGQSKQGGLTRVVQPLPRPARGGVQNAFEDVIGGAAALVTGRERRPHRRPGLGAVGPVADQGAIRVLQFVEPPPSLRYERGQSEIMFRMPAGTATNKMSAVA